MSQFFFSAALENALNILSLLSSFTKMGVTGLGKGSLNIKTFSTLVIDITQRVKRKPNLTWTLKIGAKWFRKHRVFGLEVQAKLFLPQCFNLIDK